MDTTDMSPAMRPKRLSEFTGQERAMRNLAVAIEAARQRQTPLDHALLSGPPGLGKTTIARMIAEEMETEIVETTGPCLDRPGDLAGILSSLRPGAVLFIDEIHAMDRVVEEYLYSAMEDFRITITMGDGATAHSLTLNLQPFTLIGATTREGSLSAPLRSRFGIHERLDLYSSDELTQIIARSAKIIGLEGSDDSWRCLAERCRGTPRIANGYLRRIRDWAQVESVPSVSAADMDRWLGHLGVDAHGLTPLDHRLLDCLAQAGRPVGIKSLAVAVDEEALTIESVYEPYLLQQGWLTRTPQGRMPGPRKRNLHRAIGSSG